MVVFSSRSAGYKVGFIALLATTVIYIVGFSAPYWAEPEHFDAHSGLWRVCLGDKCETFDITDLESWFHYVRAAECIGLAMLGLSCLFGLSENCRNQPESHTRVVERLALCGGIVGLSGAIVYFIKGQDDVVFTWAVYLATVSSAVAFVCFFIIYNYNPPPTVTMIPAAVFSHIPETGGVVVAASTAEGGGVAGGVVNPGGPQAPYPGVPPHNNYGMPPPQAGFSTQYIYTTATPSK